MKKKTKNYNKHFKMPHLFREDLEKIEDIIKNELKPKEYHIEFNNFEYDGISEVSSDTQSVSEFYLQTYSPYINVGFDESYARVYAGDDDLQTMGAVTKIIEVISRKERKHLFAISKLSCWLSPIIFGAPFSISWILIELYGKNVLLSKIWSLFVLSFLAVIWWIIGYRNSFYNFSVIEFVYKKEKVGFLTRNKDQIILIIIGAILGTFITILFQRIFK